MNNYFFAFIFIFTSVIGVFGQATKKVLFIGNSYTSVNDLPSIVNAMATNTGDILIFDSNSPGGYRFLNHAVNATTLSKINANAWDYVVLQAQSQETAFSESQKQSEVYPYAASLSNSIRQNNECSQPLFYMTWGRENGDASLCSFIPWACTYEGMDEAIKTSYLFMSQSNNAEVAPAGAVWRYLRVNFPSIDLYSSDSSHPSEAGSYAAACALYTMIFKKDPTLITWNFNLTAIEANTIRSATKIIVFDELPLWNFTTNPSMAAFTEEIQEATVVFTNASEGFENVEWDFGDGTSSLELNPIHTYEASGSYVVTLTTEKCGKLNVKSKTLDINADLTINDLKRKSSIVIYPNPTKDYFKVQLEKSFKTGAAFLYDFKGTQLYTMEISDISTFEMDLTSLKSGVYILKMHLDEHVLFSKVVKL